MDLAKISLIFKVIIIILIYVVIFIAMRLIYKDMKNGSRTRTSRRSFGLEVMETSKGSTVKKGSLIPIQRMLTIGRKEDNNLHITDPYASSYHAKIYLKNEEYILEDLGSTNGTSINGEKLTGKIVLKPGDEIKIASYDFKVIG